MVFSEDYGSIINAALDLSPKDAPAQSYEQPPSKDSAKDPLPDYKYRKNLVSRIAKAVKAPFEDALRKESEMCQKSIENEFANLDRLLANSASRRVSFAGSQFGRGEAGHVQSGAFINEGSLDGHQVNGATEEDAPGDIDVDFAAIAHASAEESNPKGQRPTPESMPSTNGVNGVSEKVNGFRSASDQASEAIPTREPPTPPMSFEGDHQPLSCGGIPWYMDPFDPVGTTIQEERWTGRELVRGMSEDLSDMDEEELSGLLPVDAEDAPLLVNGVSAEQAAKVKAKRRKAARARRRW